MSRLREFFIGFRNTSQDLKPWGIPKIHFLKTEWEEIDNLRVSWRYLIWRGLYALFCVFAVSFSLCASSHRHIWLIFLTHWSLTCQLIYSLLFFITVVHHVRVGSNGNVKHGNKHSNPQTPSQDVKDIELTIPGHVGQSFERFPHKNNKVESVVWMLSGIVGTLPIFVTLGYWILVYPTDVYYTPTDYVTTFLIHGVNAIFALIDTMIIALPVRVTHFAFLTTFGITYAIFSRLYELAGGPYPQYVNEPERPYIYSVLNWHENPDGAYVTCAFTIPVVIILYSFLWFLYILRLRLVFSFSSRRDRKSCHFLHQYWLHDEPKTVI